MNQLQRALSFRLKTVRRLPRPPRLLPPINIEKAYTRELVGILRLLRELFRTNVKPHLEGMVADFNSLKPDAARKDAAEDDFTDYMDGVAFQLSEEYSDDDLMSLAQKYGIETSDYNAMQQLKTLKRVLGVDVFAAEPWLRPQIAAFALENVSLIKSVKGKAISEIETSALRGFQMGKRWEAIAADIESRITVAESRARLIGRDQINKLNGQLTQLRQTNLGIEKFIWRTSLDERVRESHQELEGETYRWDDPPDVDGESAVPGEPIQCVPEDAFVSLHSPAVKAFRRWHAGELTSIISNFGEPLRITSNHPVLTIRGWIPAHLVKVGDYLVDTTIQSTHGSVHNPKGGKSTAKQVFSALQKGGISHRVRGGALGFHGDSINQKVDVVWANRRLLEHGKAKFTKSFSQNQFTVASQAGSRQGHFSFNPVAFFDSSYSGVSGFRPSFSLGGGRKLHSIEHRIASASNLNAMREENSPDWPSRYFESLSDGELALAIQIRPNDFVFRKVCSVVTRSWSGWVHNFETLTGWFSSVNLAIHNCRCWAEAVIEQAEDTETEESEL